MIWVYGIAAADLALPSGTGVDGAPLSTVPEGRVSAVVSAHDTAPPEEADRDRVLAHAAVVERVHADGAVLPVRFATTYRDASRLAEALRGQQEQLVAGLDRVAGRVEYGVRLGDTRSPTTTAPTGPERAASGREYLAAVAARERAVATDTDAAEDLVAAIDAALVDLVRARRVTLRPRPGVLAEIAYLVARADAPAFDAAAADLPDPAPDAAITCTGPWPPYSFAPTAADDGR